jgi:hypothetical protein
VISVAVDAGRVLRETVAVCMSKLAIDTVRPQAADDAAREAVTA